MSKLPSPIAERVQASLGQRLLKAARLLDERAVDRLAARPDAPVLRTASRRPEGRGASPAAWRCLSTRSSYEMYLALADCLRFRVFSGVLRSLGVSYVFHATAALLNVRQVFRDPNLENSSDVS